MAHMRAETLHQIKGMLLDGQVIIFLGAGVNLSERPEGTDWRAARSLPDGRELAAHLSEYLHRRELPPQANDLLSVSQYLALVSGNGALYRELHEVFNQDYPPTRLHRLIAELPARLAEHACKSPAGVARKRSDCLLPLVVTTNYDDLMENAFRQAGQEFDLVVYQADGVHAGKFLHVPPRSTGLPEAIIADPSQYKGLAPKQRPVLLKIHGTVDRSSEDEERDSYVITEDHYIDYLTRTENGMLPVAVAKILKFSHILFLGYSLRDWNLRVLLQRVWREAPLSYASWAVLRQPSDLDVRFWRNRGVELLDVELGNLVADIDREIPPTADAGERSGDAGNRAAGAVA